MTKSADHGMFYEDAFIVQTYPSYRYTQERSGLRQFHYCNKGQRLDDTRRFVARNKYRLVIQYPQYLTQPRFVPDVVSAETSHPENTTAVSFTPGEIVKMIAVGLISENQQFVLTK